MARNITNNKIVSGECRNTSGSRQKIPDELKKSLKSWGQEAIEFLYKTMKDDKTPLKYRITCASDLADRAFGKPPQAIETDGDIKAILIL